ncbi:MAG: hypothetical protein ABI843_15100 [Dokdonella sp.]
MTTNGSTRTTAWAMRSRGMGILVCAAFAAFWASSSRSEWPTAFVAAGYAIIALITAALVIVGITLIRRGRQLPLTPNAARVRQRRSGGLFAALVAAEIVAMNVAAYVLAGHHLEQYLIPAIAIIVGLHFYPLARLFRAPFFYVTASLMTLAGIGGVAVIAGGLAVAPVVAAVDVICAITLWGTGLASWISTARSDQRQPEPRLRE